MSEQRDPVSFGFIVSNYLYHEYDSYEKAKSDRQRLSKKAHRPKNFSIMKQFNADGSVCYFVTNHKYKQARTFDVAARWFQFAMTSRGMKKPHPKVETRIRMLINKSGALGADDIKAAQAFFQSQIADFQTDAGGSHARH